MEIFLEDVPEAFDSTGHPLLDNEATRCFEVIVREDHELSAEFVKTIYKTFKDRVGNFNLKHKTTATRIIFWLRDAKVFCEAFFRFNE